MGKLQVFEIVFHNGKSVYNPSEFVSGKCIVDLRGEMKMTSLRITMKGEAKVHWTEMRRSNNRSTMVSYNAEINYLRGRQVLFVSATSSGPAVLNDGRHEFHFSFQLPRGEIPTSFEGKYGSIRYWLNAEIVKSWAFNHNVKKEFTIICPIDINRNEYLGPVENNTMKTLSSWCWACGKVTLYARTDRKGYCPGESIAISADFENASSRTIVPHAALRQTITFFAAGKYRTTDEVYATVTGLAIQPGKTTSWNAQLLNVPALPPSNINCRIIHVEYDVMMTLKIPRASNLSMDLPIVIGTVPLHHMTFHNISPMLENVDKTVNNEMYDSSVPSYSQLQMPTVPMDDPPSYEEYIEGYVSKG